MLHNGLFIQRNDIFYLSILLWFTKYSDLDKGAYWGYMSFTQSTHYLGIIAILLAILGPLLKKLTNLKYFFG